MKSSQRQKLKLQQTLSPQQILLMQLVQLPVTTLEQRLKEEVEKNPMLEVLSDNSCTMEQLPHDSIEDTTIHDLVSSDTDDDDYSYRERQERDRGQMEHEVTFVTEKSFSDYLIEQLNLKVLSPLQRAIAEEIVGSLDDAGYISRSTALIANDMAFTKGLEVSVQEVEEALLIVQSLEPAGVAARNLQECLAIQLHRAEHPDEATLLATQVIDHHFDHFANHNYNRIIETLSVSEEQLQDAINIIRRLNPKPGIGETVSSHAHYIIPDFIVSRHDEEVFLTINDSHLPQLQMSLYYQDQLQQLESLPHPSHRDSEAIAFIRTHTDNANLLINALQQRHITLMKVMRYVLAHQRQFFLTGDSADLRPLLQKDVAAATGYDISTISRVVNSKYVQTDFGTFLLKECFSQSVVNSEGEEIATERIRQALQDAVDNEDKQAPLSDDALAQLLNQQGFPVARRTVAKYRLMLGIPVCRLRRQLKIIILLVLSLSGLCTYAQQPQKASYFDSILNARIREGQSKSRAESANANGGKKGNNKGKKSNTHGGTLEIHEPEPDPCIIDSALATGDELINVMYNASLPAPSALWYGRNLSGTLVRLRNLSMDSLPDEITIKLVKGDEKFCFPVKNIITSPYGWRWNRPHRGVDIRLKTGDPVRSAFNGVVRIARPMGGYGNLVVVRHYNGLETVYGHLSKINVKPLQVVAAGQVIGLGGSTGHSTGPHLHFEVRFLYEPFDPEWILDFSNYSIRTHTLYLDKTYFGIRPPRNGTETSYKADKSIVPEERPKPKTNKPIYANIRKGDTFSTIAARNRTTEEKLRELNPDITKLKPGTQIRVR